MMTAEERHRRDRQAIYALLIGILGAGCTWLAAQLEPGQMLCIEERTLLTIGGTMTVVARTLGEALARVPAGFAEKVLRGILRFVSRKP